MGEPTWWERVKGWLGFGWDGACFYASHGEPFGWRERLWNATRWRVEATTRFADHVPSRFRRAYFLWNSDVVVYMLPPLHWLGRAWDWWRSNRFALERWFAKHGALKTREERQGYLIRWHEWPFEWRWPFVSAYEHETEVWRARSEGFTQGRAQELSHGAMDLIENQRNALTAEPTEEDP